ncbi:hypothetical protein [Microbulbifer sp. VAAF005]|uniref:hypothetical protein n=1 Tax=Microbulbifer sp. VAAF005 TaxID=3034230 RepID=UPI0024AD5C9F|nr:hypothetical protein [Microbulbifer sp. VAAF005]WHI46639.1 hypothetical protein P0078_23535 [Microbulbifer sp. VAAF005]
MKTLYLHVGNFKTGTSSIQRICHDSDLDVLYPKSCRPQNNTTNHGRLTLSLLRDYGVPSPTWFNGKNIIFKNELEAIQQEILSSPKDKVLISSEELFSICASGKGDEIAEALQSSFREFSVKIIMYIREPLSFLNSWYNQLNKGPHSTQNLLMFFQGVEESLLSQLPVYKVFLQTLRRRELNSQIISPDWP